MCRNSFWKLQSDLGNGERWNGMARVNVLAKFKTVYSFQHHLADRMLLHFSLFSPQVILTLDASIPISHPKTFMKPCTRFCFACAWLEGSKTIASNALPNFALLERTRFDNIWKKEEEETNRNTSCKSLCSILVECLNRLLQLWTFLDENL